jgi:long-chain acyl-CoA synthetase
MREPLIVRQSNGKNQKLIGRHGRVATRLARQIELSLLAVELSVAQYRFLTCIDEGTAESGALADRLVVTRPSVTAVADVLVTRGLVERKHEEDDRRRVSHSLTPSGREALAEADAAVEARLDRILGFLQEDQHDKAIDGFSLWNRALDDFRMARRDERA